MGSNVLFFHEIDQTHHPRVGGKAYHSGRLSRMEGVRVPEGFCVTTEAYKRVVTQREELHPLIDQLSTLKVEDREKIRDISGKIRHVIQRVQIPQGIEESVLRVLAQLGEGHAYAIRSSATAADLPHASLAAQQHTYLNITGNSAISEHLKKYWASVL